MSDLPVQGGLLDCPVVPGIGEFDAPPTDARLEREASFEGERDVSCDEERLWFSDCLLGNVIRDSIVSEPS